MAPTVTQVEPPFFIFLGPDTVLTEHVPPDVTNDSEIWLWAPLLTQKLASEPQHHPESDPSRPQKWVRN